MTRSTHCLFFFSFIFFSSFLFSVTQSTKNVHVVASFVRDSSQIVHYEIVKPALELAIDEVNDKYRNRLRFTINIKNDTTSCFSNLAGAVIAEEFYQSTQSVDAIFGPSCDTALDQVARMAAVWNVPIFTAGGFSTQFGDKQTYSTLTRLSFSIDRVSHFIIQILKENDWHHVSVILDETDPPFMASKKSLDIMIEREKSDFASEYEYDIVYYEIKKMNAVNVTLNLQDRVMNASRRSRVFLLMMPSNLIRDVLLSVKDLDLDPRQFVFIAVELIKESTSSASNDISWYRLGSRRNADAKALYQSLMIISVRIPISEEFETFASRVVKRAAVSSSRGESRKLTKADVNPIVAAFYDAVLLYASVLNQTLSSASSKSGTNDTSHARSNPSNVIHSIWGRKFNSIGSLTGDIFINENGDREADYTLNDLDPESGVMIPVATYFGSDRKYEKNTGVDVHWPSEVPLDIPVCGYDGLAAVCQPNSNRGALIGLLISVLFIMSISGVGLFFVRKKVKEDQEMNDLWWKLDPSEIEIIERKKSSGGSSVSNVKLQSKSVLSVVSRSAASLGNKSTKSRASGTNYSTTITNLSGIDIGMFRGQKVAVKTYEMKTRIYTTRDVLVEMNKMRECQMHDNLVKFFGLTLEDTCFVLNELCIRGSLRDIIENESVEIDWLFRYAILTDVVEGMYFLHSTSLKYHGHLKSANLLVDGRFTVKISDYGLNCVYDRRKPDEETNPRDLFWTAPEHLRAKDPLRAGSQKGDVYAFAIICREVITRMGPYDPTSEVMINSKRYLDPDEILDKVRVGSNPPFRPELNATDCLESPDLLELTRKCWEENPALRPEFGRIKISMRKITKGKSSKNFLDNLLKRMEQYSNSLEAIVNEKTATIVEEKMRAEELIHQMLPSFIAEELKMGKHVDPEAFDSVTIFFSDIVGFKEVSDKATPEEAVNLLNDVYATMDAILETYDVFKVETIADSYLIASGVPVKNGNEHAKNIARMALDMRSAMKSFRPRHQIAANDKLQIRIGINSGSCVAGVVGLKLPKYCLFGDAINTASRMETNGEAGRIHISSVTKSILELFGCFIVIPRGEIEIKGKGKVKTFWLEGEERVYKK